MKRAANIFIIILAAGAIGYFAYSFIKDWHEKQIETAREEVREEIQSGERPPVPKEKLIEAFGESPSDISPEDRQPGPEEIERQIMAFFSYLDSQQYASKIKGGTYLAYQQTVKELSANLPVIAGETESLHTLYKNMAHFFRVLGINRINLAKDILSNESEIIEALMNNFYLWFTINSGSRDMTKDRPSLNVLYNYSGFFLNTLAGKSYLLRRDTRISTLTTYYCILILDRANDAVLNSYGIDIRPHIKSLINIISSYNSLINREQYLRELGRLEKKYQL